MTDNTTNVTRQLSLPFADRVRHKASSLLSVEERPFGFSIRLIKSSSSQVEVALSKNRDRFIIYSALSDPWVYGLWNTGAIIGKTTSLILPGNVIPEYYQFVQRGITWITRQQISRLHRAIPRNIRLVAAAVSRASDGHAFPLDHPDALKIYKDSELVAQIVKYPAAASTFANLKRLVEKHLMHKVKRQVERLIEPARKEAKQKHGLQIDLNVHPAYEEERSPDLYSHFKEWPKLLSASGRPYKNLMLTLRNYDLTDSSLIQHLPGLSLQRAITNRSELQFLLEVLRIKAFNYDLDVEYNDLSNLVHIAERASRQEIEKGISMLTPMWIPEDVAHSTAIAFLVRFCCFPTAGNHKGGVCGLTRKGLLYQKQRNDKTLKRLGRNPKIKPPPIPLPQSNYMQITLLDSVAAFQRTGQEFFSCLGNSEHIIRAVNGECYYFLISCGDARITASVSRSGSLGEIVGPRNSAVSPSIENAVREMLLWWSRTLCAHEFSEPYAIESLNDIQGVA